MYELIYRSQAKQELTTNDISDILEIARKFNSKNQITGCLLYYNNEFIQILEGEKEILHKLFTNIQKDTRHNNVILLAEAEKQDRIFPNWSMAYHEIGTNDNININKLLFVNNFITLSELIAKPTRATKLFWYMAKQLLEQ